MPTTPLRRPRIPTQSGPPAPMPTRVGRARVAARATDSTPLWKDPFRLGILALLIDTIAKATGEIPAAAAIRPGLLLFCFCGLYAVLKPSTSVNMDVFRQRVTQLIIAQAILACGSALFGISLGHAAVYIITVYWKTLAVALLLILSLRNMNDVRYMVWATAGGGILLSFTSVFIDHINKNQGNGVYDANDIGTIVVMTLPLTIFAMQMAKGVWRLAWIGGLVLIAETIVISSSRGAFVGLLFVGLALLLFLPGVSVIKRLAYLGSITAVLAVFAPDGYWLSMKNIIVNPTEDYNWDAGQGRRQIAQRGIGYMLDHPVFGLGIDNFDMQEGMYSDYAKERIASGHGVKWSAPHNSWVEAGAETGIPGLLIWVGLVVGGVVPLIRLRRRMPKAWATSGTTDQRFAYLATLYVPISLLGFVVCATFVSFAWSDQSYVVPAIAMGVQMCCERQFGLNNRPVTRMRGAAPQGARVARPGTA
jgi:O-antigen ligase